MHEAGRLEHGTLQPSSTSGFAQRRMHIPVINGKASEACPLKEIESHVEIFLSCYHVQIFVNGPKKKKKKTGDKANKCQSSKGPVSQLLESFDGSKKKFIFPGILRMYKCRRRWTTANLLIWFLVIFFLSTPSLISLLIHLFRHNSRTTAGVLFMWLMRPLLRSLARESQRLPYFQI